MADILKIYKNDEVVASAERGEDGKANVTIEGLDADTEYEAGTYQSAFSNEHGESNKTDIPSFKTNPIKVTSVKLDKSETSVETGQTDKFVATVSPSTASNSSVSYQSSDESIATIDNNGQVTGVNVGQTEITVTTEDGNKTAQATVTVTEAQS